MFQLCLPNALLALTSAPDISDREAVEKLAKREAGQHALNHRISDLRSKMKAGHEALDKRLDSPNDTMLVLFGSIITLIVALFAYIAWDRRTIKPVLEQLNQLEHRAVDVVDDLDLRNVEGSLLARQL